MAVEFAYQSMYRVLKKVDPILVDFQKTIGAAFKPILGCELYLCDNSALVKDPSNRKLKHQVVLAKNLKGWKNLLSLVSQANHPNNFYHKPRLDINQLEECVGKDLVSFSGHLGSRLAMCVLDNPDWQRDGEKEARFLENIFGKGNFFIEIHN